MTVVNPKSISGINSITTGSGSDDLLTIHTNNGTERLRVDSTGATKIVTGIVTTLTATTGIVTTLTANTVTANTTAKVGTGITLSPDGDVFTTGVTTCLGTAVLGNAIIGSGTTITADGVNAGIITANELISSAPLPSLKLLDSANNYYAYLDGNSGNLILHADKGAGNSDSNMKFAIDNATKMTLNADGELGVGGSFDPNQMIDVRKSDSSTFNAASNLPTMIRAYNTSATNGACAGIQIRADNSAGAAGIQYIHAVSSSTNYDSDLVFSRRLATSGTYAEACRITNSGNLAFPNGGGIDFYNYGSGSNITSNALDDYEEGTFSPAFKAENNSSNATTNVHEASYTKIGNLVYFRFFITLTAHASGTTGGSAFVNGLPFTNQNGHAGVSIGYFAAWNASQMYVTATVQPSSNSILFRHYLSASSATNNMDYDNNLQPTSNIIMSGCYQAA